MKQLFIILLLIVGMQQADAGKIVKVNCPYMQGPSANTDPRGVLNNEFDDGNYDITDYDCIPIVNREIHFGFELKTTQSISPLLLNNTYLRVKINDEIVELIEISDFSETQNGQEYYYNYLFTCADPLEQAPFGATTFTLEVELLLSENLWADPNDVIPFPTDVYENLFIEYEPNGPPNTEFSAEVTSCNALETVIHYGGLLPRPPKLSYLGIKNNSDKNINNLEFEFQSILNDSLESSLIDFSPNPFNNQLSISLPQKNTDQIKLAFFDSVGRKLFVEQVGSDAEVKTIDTSNLKAGVYICKIYSNSFEKNIRLIKSK